MICGGRMKFYGAGELSGVKFCDESEFRGVKILKRLIKFRPPFRRKVKFKKRLAGPWRAGKAARGFVD